MYIYFAASLRGLDGRFFLDRLYYSPLTEEPHVKNVGKYPNLKCKLYANILISFFFKLYSL